MKLLDILERKLRRWAIPNLTMVIIAGQVAIYCMRFIPPLLKSPDVVLIPELVFKGQVWRLFSFIFTPPVSDPFWAFFFWYVFYLMGTALEHTWGTFRYNVYLLIGWVATVAVSFLVPDQPASITFLQGSVFLAFAWLYPNFEMLIFFILPVKVKWLALLTWLWYGYILLIDPPMMKLLVFASIANFFVFFGSEIWHRMLGGRRRMADQVGRIKSKDQARHRCRVCGITERTHPNEDFRYCSKCEGTQCYCSAHLRDHEHVTTTNQVRS